jgi:hypothetical protein
MITPGFSAEASLYGAEGCYSSAANVMQTTGALYPAQLAASGGVDTCVNVTCPSICALRPNPIRCFIRCARRCPLICTGSDANLELGF